MGSVSTVLLNPCLLPLAARLGHGHGRIIRSVEVRCQDQVGQP